MSHPQTLDTGLALGLAPFVYEVIDMHIVGNLPGMPDHFALAGVQ